jgi:hypothetical protein
MKMNRTLTAVVAAGMLGLMSAPVIAGNTAGASDTAAKASPPIVLVQESPAEERHEQKLYDEQMRADQHKAKETAMNYHKHHHKHYKHHVQSVPESNNNNGHDANSSDSSK